MKRKLAILLMLTLLMTAFGVHSFAASCNHTYTTEIEYGNWVEVDKYVSIAGVEYTFERSCAAYSQCTKCGHSNGYRTWTETKKKYYKLP